MASPLCMEVVQSNQEHRQPDDQRRLEPVSFQPLENETDPEPNSTRIPDPGNRLESHGLQQRGEQVLFLLMVPVVKPNGAKAEFAQVRAHEIHQRTLAAAPRAID